MIYDVQIIYQHVQMNYHQWSFKDHSLTAIVISLLPILCERQRIRCRNLERTSAQVLASTLILREDADRITAITRNQTKHHYSTSDATINHSHLPQTMVR
jgi:hypothetical protein